MFEYFYKKVFYFIMILSLSIPSMAQIPASINSGNPNFPFPQFLDYNGGSLKTLGSYDHNMVGVPHAELELRIREAYAILCNDMTYTGEVVAGVKYIKPTAPQHCTCVEGDGYYLLAAAYMGDKATFDGYYMWAHDRGFNKTVRFIDGVTNSATYLYSKGLSGAGGFGAATGTMGAAAGNNSAADGDFDVAMALLVAYKQWGSASGITPPATGVQIDYKQEALTYIHGLVDANGNPTTNTPTKWDVGDIGLDGYVKGGDTWGELTGWATAGYTGMIPEFTGPTKQHIDYYAPAYFKSFYNFFTAESQSAFSINQLKRAEASSDWLVGQMASQGLVGFAGWVDMTSGTPVFSAFDIGEDFRTPWRTNLNYVWNGNPTTSWNPTTHQVVAGGNTYEYNSTLNSVAFFNDPQAKGNAPISLAGVPITYCGPITVQQQHLPDGTGGNAFRLSWPHATFSPAATAVQDFTLMAKMYRQCEITWDGNTDVGQQYLASKPRYFHEWFRLMGMMILSGNYHDPMNMVPVANMKVYKDVDKTYAFVGDTITYTITYRNYGKPDATGVQIVDNLPAGLTYISSSVSASASGSSVTFNVGAVKGTNVGIPANLNQTTGLITMKVKVGSTATGRLCNTATIICTNGTGWQSNEYPNNVTEVMQRNCVDILTQNPLVLTKAASKPTVQVGDTLSYTLIVKNKTVDFLNGGRQGVQVAFGHQGLSTSSSEIKLNFRIYHGAEESYINYQNYRLSYFLNKPGPPSWQIDLPLSTNEGFSGQIPTIAQQNLTPGVGYNHRFFITFPDQIATITPYLLNYYSNSPYIHRGALMPARIEMRVFDPSYNLWNWTTDWSADPNILVASGDAYFPVGDNWTDPLNPGIPVTKIHPDACTNVSYVTKKVLVEEWDGYTWRRAYGNAPVSGRQLANVKVTDTLPSNVVFGGFFPGYPAGTVSGNVITWPTIANMNINDSTVYKFWVTVKPAAYFGCPAGPTPATIVNKAGAKADKEKTVLASATTNVSCTAVVLPSSSMTKTADKATYAVGDNVNYTITYKNKSGTIVSGATVAADWTDVAGNGKLTITGGTIDLNANWTNKLMTYNYSHGTNGIIKGTLTIAQDQVDYAIVMRQKGNTWVELRFKVTSGNLQMTLWDYGITAANSYTQIGAVQQLNYTNRPGAFDFQLQLSGSSLNVWAVNPGVAMSTSPLLTFTGVPIQAGYAGVRSVPANAATLASWYTNLDSAFDLIMTDPLLSNLSFVSATSATYNTITYTGSNVAGTITWQKVAGPILANDQIVYTWTAKVTNCLSPTFTNIALAKVLGITPDLAGLVTTNCSSSTTCVPPSTLTITPATQTLCAGAALTVTGAYTLGTPTGVYQYTWYKGAYSVANIVSGPSTTYTNFTKAAVVAADAGTYTLRIEDYTAPGGVAACYKEASMTLTVNPVLVPSAAIAVSPTGAICAGTSVTFTATPTNGGAAPTYQWKLAGVAIAGATNATYTTTGAANSDSYTVTLTSNALCASPTTATSTAIIMTVNPVLVPSAAIAVSPTGAICAGTSVTFTATPTNGGATPAYVWKKGGAAIPGATNATYTTTGAANGDSYTVTLTSNALCASPTTATSTAIVMIVNPVLIPVVTIATPSTTICAGTSITFTATPTNGGSTPGYQWYKGTAPGTAITSATNATYTTTTASNGDNYYVVLTSTATCASPLTATSNQITITVTTAATPAVTISTPSTTICAGTGVTFTAVPGNGGTTPTYQWYKGTAPGTAISSATNATYTTTGAANNDSYYVIMTSNSGCVVAPGTATSNAIVMTVSPNVTPTVTIATPATTICAGTSITFTASPTNGGTTPTYQWYKGTAPGTAIATATNATYTTTGAANGDSYYVVMTSNATCVTTAAATSNQVAITITTAVIPAVSITAGLAGSICAGTSVTFTASPGNGGSAPTYEWFIKKTTDPAPVSQGAASTTASTFTSATLTNGDQVSVIMTSNSGCVVTPGTATSNVITMTVNPNVTPTVTLTADKTSICPGDLVTYTATSTNGGAPTYTWSGTPTAAGTGATYSTTALTSPNSVTVTVTVNSTVTCVTSATATSTPVVVTVTPVPAITVSISPDVTSICANNPVQFTATVGGTGSTPAPKYEWFVTSAATATGGTSQGTASTTATTFTTSALTATNNKVYVQVVSNATCAATTPVASNVVAITVNAGIGAGTVGSDQTICYNSIPAALTETVAPTGIVGTPTYQWEGSTDNGITVPFTAIPGATNSGYTSPIAITQDVYVRRVITDPGTPAPCNVATSNTIHITVRPQLVAGVIGSDESTCSGAATATMSETTAPTGGTGTYTYQWQSDAAAIGVFADITGATNSSYTSAALTRTTQFQRVETSGTCGNVISNIVTKTITTPEVVTASINDPGQVCAGSAAFTFTATAATTGTGTLSYAWTLGGTAVGTNSSSYSYSPVLADDNKIVQVVVSTSNGCNAGPATSNQVTLDIVGATTPTVAITTNNNPNCAGLVSTFTATSTGGGTSPGYQWYVIPFGLSTPTAVGTGGTTYSTSSLNNGDQVYVELTSSLGCLIGTNPFTSNKITMVIKPIPAPAITEGNQTVCSPNSFTFHGIVTAGNTYEWKLNGQPTGITTPDITATQSGTYTLFEDNGTCNSTSAPVTLNIVQTPVANAGTDIYIKQGDVSSLNGSGGAVYSWSPATYLSSTAVSSPGFTATQTITYTLTVSDASSTCSSTDDVTVFVVSPVEVPNVITVNGDGTNDTWEIKNIEGYPNVVIEIYNRWGNLVWKSDGYPKNWDGTNFRNGQVLPEGTYFYIINLQSQIYDEPLTGWVQIIK
jgi:gliding motility-associated-like protein/uncharacterized repeat protein (TIGR01451 family)